ncbi:low temperature requirement protein A [Mycolicibacterium sp. 22603]|uniref:low temperature requirement protein A n=1 Tax=Mycolicibacterium sp. 22603 TaxID=3453950 RepID=UPI003F878BCA
MSGRDPHESHRVASPLELLFDLTFVIAFGVAASQFAHAFAAGHVGAGLAGFAFAIFAVCWAWINFTWFASAYDTDDWVYRLTTMLQMVGVLILALGLPAMFASLEHGGHVDNVVMVAGYVVMRVAMVAQWLRAARQDPARRRACLTYAAIISVAQIGWIAVILLHTGLLVTGVLVLALTLFEMAGPVVAERRAGGTPWHAHHIAERYGLMAIIALGEGVVGTVATLTAVVSDHGWSTEAILVAVAGVGLTFGMWWMYFMVPAGELLHAHRETSFWFGYLPIVLFGAIVGTGAGLHLAAYYLEEHSELGSAACVATVAIPVAVYIWLVYLLHVLMLRATSRVHLVLSLLASAVLAGSVLLAATGVPIAVCLLVTTLAPVVVVLGHETVGHRHTAAAVAARVSG